MFTILHYISLNSKIDTGGSSIDGRQYIKHKAETVDNTTKNTGQVSSQFPNVHVGYGL